MRLKVLLGAALCAVAALAVTSAAGNAGSSAQPAGRSGKISFVGTVTLSALSTAQGKAGTDISNELTPHIAQVDRALPNRQNSAHLSAAHVPTPAGTSIAAANPGFSGFDGLTHRDQRLAGGGNQFSLEPPDQALAVGGGFVLEGVNDALAVYSTSGALLAGPVTFSSFFKEAPIVTRNAQGQIIAFGPFVFDPRAYFDAGTGRWFVVEAEIDTDPVTGDFLGHAVEELAVSKTSDPRGAWNIYRIEVTNNGANGTPNHTGCPCFGDFPQIGADANGFFISTNEFSIFGPDFNGAQIYAISKAQLVAGAKNPTTVLLDGDPTPLAEGAAGTVHPASSPNAVYETGAGGTEYFLSNLDFTNTVDDRIAVWAATNTSSLNTATPNLSLTNVVLQSQSYGIPPNAEQKDGPLPLGDLLSPGASAHTPLLNTIDDRFGGPVSFAAGKLWGALATIVKQSTGGTKAASAWFIVQPSVAGGSLIATIARQGYVSVEGENVFFPTIGVNGAGKGVMTTAFSSKTRFPSAAYVPIDLNGAGQLHVAAAGVGPADGFTGYLGGNVERWGDYSSATAAADGSIWGAVEYIPNKPRTQLANWGTFISHVTP
jgi:hypothetical protein